MFTLYFCLALFLNQKPVALLQACNQAIVIQLLRVALHSFSEVDFAYGFVIPAVE